MLAIHPKLVKEIAKLYNFTKTNPYELYFKFDLFCIITLGIIFFLPDLSLFLRLLSPFLSVSLSCYVFVVLHLKRSFASPLFVKFVKVHFQDFGFF